MKTLPSKLSLSLIAATVLTLSACGGGGSGGTPLTGALVTGVAATGLAIDKGRVTLSCTNGSTTPVTTAADGSFTVDVSAVTLPCVAKVDYADAAGAAHRLHSLVRSVGNVNITPLTDMVVANLSATGVAADVKASDVHSYSDQRISTATQSVKSHLETQGVHTASLPDDVIGTKLSATHGASKGDSHDSVLDDIKAKLDAKHKTLGEVENELNSGHETRGLSTSTGQPGDAAAGKLAYEATCQSCHGAAIHDAVNASKILKAIQENEGGMGSLHIDTITADNIATYLAHGGSSSGTTTPPTTALTTQTITFASPGAQTLGATAPILSANASSGLMVTLTSVTSTVCSVNASTLTLMTAGNCTLKASQAGDSSYAAANTVVVTFSVTDPNVTVTTPPTTGLTAVAATGKVLYANCSGCHGAAAANGSLVLNGANSAATIQAAINSNVGGMRRLSSLTAQNLADIAAYLATPNI